MNQNVIFIILTSLLFFGCTRSVKPKTPTTVVLVENEKKHNAVVVSTDKGEEKLDKVREFVNLKSKNSRPSQPEIMSEKEFKQRFSDIVSIPNPKPLRYFFYLKKEKRELTSSSKKLIDKVISSIINNAPCVVDFIGHTDTVGTEKENIEKSKKEAIYVESIFKIEILKALTGIKNITLTTKGYGENDLFIPTADNIYEVKNRNVEIFIK